MISAYSFVMSVIFFNIALIFVYALRRKRDFIAKYGIQILITITALGFARLVLPIDLEAAHIIRSYNFIPSIQNALNQPIAGNSFGIGKTLLALWAIGTIVFLLKDIVAIIRFKSRRARYESCENAAISEVAVELEINHKVMVTPNAPVPYVAGYFKQTIFIPPLELDKDDWKYILMHERQHIKEHDQFIKLLFIVIRAIFWWNPISHLFMHELDAILELRCDYNVTKNLSEQDSLSYFTVIYRVVKQLQPKSQRKLEANTALIDIRSRSRDDIIQRFEVYKNSDIRRSKRVRNAIQIFICAVFIASYFVVVQPAYDPPEDDLIGVDNEIEDKTFIVCRDNKYFVCSSNGLIMEIPAEEINNFPYNTFEIYEGVN